VEINIRGDSIVEVWLTKEESRNTVLQEQLKPLYRKWKEKHYLVAVFISGTKDLFEGTRDLLLYNKKRIVDLELRKQKEAYIDACN